jgi:hypothetical protein
MDYYITLLWDTDKKFCGIYDDILKKKNITLSEQEVTITDNDDIRLFWAPDIFIPQAKDNFMQSQILSTKFMTIRKEKNICKMTLISR